jgi:hypothetical protein
MESKRRSSARPRRSRLPPVPLDGEGVGDDLLVAATGSGVVDAHPVATVEGRGEARGLDARRVVGIRLAAVIRRQVSAGANRRVRVVEGLELRIRDVEIEVHLPREGEAHPECTGGALRIPGQRRLEGDDGLGA